MSLVPMPRRARRHANTNSRPQVFCYSTIALTKLKAFPVNSAHASAYQTGSTVERFEPVLSVSSQAFNNALRPSTPTIPMAWNLSHVVGLLLAISLTIVGCGIFWLTNALKPLLKVRLKAFDSASQMYTANKLTSFMRIVSRTILHQFIGPMGHRTWTSCDPVSGCWVLIRYTGDGSSGPRNAEVTLCIRCAQQLFTRGA